MNVVTVLQRKLAKRRWARHARRFDDAIERVAAATKDFFVVQVGACDGILADPIHEWIKKYDWHGILVEPQQREFERLKVTYRDHPHLRFENVAIADTEGMRPFYRVHEDRADAEWQRGVASLVAKPKFVRDDMVVTDLVPCITFDTLLSRYGVERIDLLQIDAEGYDYALIRSFDFSRVRPRLVRYEHLHLEPADRRACARYLEREGYDLLEMQYDTGALLGAR